MNHGKFSPGDKGDTVLEYSTLTRRRNETKQIVFRQVPLLLYRATLTTQRPSLNLFHGTSAPAAKLLWPTISSLSTHVTASGKRAIRHPCPLSRAVTKSPATISAGPPHDNIRGRSESCY
jgi:hypothetical protein